MADTDRVVPVTSLGSDEIGLYSEILRGHVVEEKGNFVSAGGHLFPTSVLANLKAKGVVFEKNGRLYAKGLCG